MTAQSSRLRSRSSDLAHDACRRAGWLLVRAHPQR